MNKITLPIKKLLIIVLLIVGIMILYEIYSEDQSNNCYIKCSDYHLVGVEIHWDYQNFVIDGSDTIWIDEECYNDWCICIDECSPGLCCELLR